MKQFLSKTEKWCHKVKDSVFIQKISLKQLAFISANMLWQEHVDVFPARTFQELLKFDDNEYMIKHGNIHVLFIGHLFLMILCS